MKKVTLLNPKIKTLIGVLVIGILLIGVWWVWKNYYRLSEKAKIPSNWKTYTNKEYGFEIKYPQNWNVVAPYFGGVGLFSIAFYPSDKMYSAYGIFFDLTLVPKEGDFQKIQKEWETKMEKEREKFLQSNFEKRVIDENTVLFKISGIIKGEKNMVAEGYIIHLTDNFCYIFSFHTLSGKETVDILEQMLSTFRFFEQDKTANWKIYRNEEYGYRIKYPPDWKISIKSPHEVFWSSSYEKPGERKYILIYVATTKNPQKYPLHLECESPGEFVINWEYVTIRGRRFCKYLKMFDEGFQGTFYEILKDNKLYQIVFGIEREDLKRGFPLSENELQPEWDIFNQMINTFEFID